MTREEYEAKIDEKLKAVKQELMAEYKEEPSIDGWKVRDVYFYNKFGKIIGTTVSYNNNDDICDFDIFMIKHGYAKHTAEEVQFQIERNAVLYELNKFAEPKDREWNKYRHYYITWNYESNTGFYIDWRCYRKHNDIYFESEEDAEKAIKEVGEERVKKYYLGVED